MNRNTDERANLWQRASSPMLAALLLLGMVSGCASVAAPSPKLQAVKTVGLISAVGGKFTLTNAGLTGFEKRDQTVSIEAWGIDDLIVSRTSALLSGRFQVQPVIYQRTAFAALDQDTAIPVMTLIREVGDDPTKDLVRAQVTPQGLDAYVVITKARSKYGSRARNVAGIGIINRTAAFDFHAQVHALYLIRVIDGHDFKVIDKKSAAPVDNTEIIRLAGPSEMFDGSVPSTADDVIGNEKLKATIINLIERSLPTTLQDLHLVDPS